MPPRNTLVDDIHQFSINKSTRTIYVHSEGDQHGEENGVDYKMAEVFIKNLDYLESLSDNEITVKIMSCGGCWNYGMAMYDAILNSKAIITSVSYAHSRSMSSIIPQAADKRLIHKHCDFMVHYGTYTDEGDWRQVANGVEFAKKFNDQMIKIYAEKCIHGAFAKEHKLTDPKKMYKFIQTKIDKLTDWWMTAEEAVYYGFMDAVI